MTFARQVMSSEAWGILILSLTAPLQPSNLRTEVIIVSLTNKHYIGKVLEVTSDTISVYRDNEVQKIETNRIKRIGIRRSSRFMTGMLGGLAIGAAFGGIMALLTKRPSDAIYIYYSSHIFAGVFSGGFTGSLLGVLASPSISKFKYYSYNSFTSKKKVKFLNKLRRKI